MNIWQAPHLPMMRKGEGGSKAAVLLHVHSRAFDTAAAHTLLLSWLWRHSGAHGTI